MAMKFAVVGCGNVGTQYARMWIQAGHQLQHVHFRSIPLGTMQWLGNSFENVELHTIHQNADAVLLAIPDDQIAAVAGSIHTDAFIIQPSGTFDLHQLAHPNKATLWAMYSIVKQASLDFEKIPFAVESTSEKAKETLHKLMEKVGAPMHNTNQTQRELAHLTAVLANNFTNALYQKALTLLNENQLSGALMLPIIAQTTARLTAMPDPTLQTGPARRGDYNTLKKHLEILREDPQWKLLYQTMSDIILQQNEHRKL